MSLHIHVSKPSLIYPNLQCTTTPLYVDYLSFPSSTSVNPPSQPPTCKSPMNFTRKPIENPSPKVNESCHLISSCEVSTNEFFSSPTPIIPLSSTIPIIHLASTSLIDPLPSYGRGRELPGGRHCSLIHGYNLTDVVITGGYILEIEHLRENVFQSDVDLVGC